MAVSSLTPWPQTSGSDPAVQEVRMNDCSAAASWQASERKKRSTEVAAMHRPTQACEILPAYGRVSTGVAKSTPLFRAITNSAPGFLFAGTVAPGLSQTVFEASCLRSFVQHKASSMYHCIQPRCHGMGFQSREGGGKAFSFNFLIFFFGS